MTDNAAPAMLESVAEPAPEATASRQPPARDPAKIAAYISRRIDPQIAWLEAKSARAKRRHFGFSGTQITATSMIPVANLMPGGHISSTVLAAIVGVATGLAALGGHHGHWLRYRATATALQKLKLHHELGFAPFDGPDADDRFVHAAEELLGGEHETWQAEALRQTAGKGSPGKVKVAKPGEGTP